MDEHGSTRFAHPYFWFAQRLDSKTQVHLKNELQFVLRPSQLGKKQLILHCK